MADTSRDDTVGLRFVGALKLASGLALGAASLGIFRLMDGDLGEALGHTVARFHLDPENRLIHGAVARLVEIDRKRLEMIGVGTLCYAALHLVEGAGLLLRLRWGAYLTVVATGSLLLPEVYAITRRPEAVRVGILLVNLLILAYLIANLVRGRSSRSDRATGSTPYQ